MRIKAITILIFTLIVSGCETSRPSLNQSADVQVIKSISLIEIGPVNHQESTRLLLGSNSVEGYYLTPEDPLTFNVELGPRARLGFLLGIEGTITGEISEGSIQCVFVNEDTSHVTEIFNSSLEGLKGAEGQFLSSNYELEPEQPTGTLSFSLRGIRGDQTDTKFFIGAPSVYYPEDLTGKNILWIGVDTLRADAVSLYGGRAIVTPEMEALGRDGTVFMQARSQSSWTLPSFASMLTGGLPSKIGTTVESGLLPDSATTIGEMLRQHGYSTSFVCGNTYLGNVNSGFQQGFDEFWFEFAASPDKTAERAIQFIDRVKERNWISFVHFLDPHGPYTPTDEYAELTIDPDYSGTFGTAFHAAEAWKSQDFIPPEQDIRRARDLYDAEVAMVDAAFGKIFDYLKTEGLFDDTLIIIAADHGEEFYEHGAFEHGHTMYDELVRVPLIVHGPGFNYGKEIDAPVGNTDIFPTILNFLGLDRPDYLQGVPLQDVIAGDLVADRIIFGEGNNRGTQRKFAVKWPYKLILDYVTGGTLLFNLDEDPSETQDISESQPGMVEGLARAITTTMLPDRTVFHVWFIGSKTEPPKRFAGTISFSSDLADAKAFGLEESDEWRIDGNTLHFDVTNTVPDMAIDKKFSIFPSEDIVTITSDITVDGEAENNCFYPYGTSQVETSGHAELSITDYPAGTEMPNGQYKLDPGLYIFGILGFQGGEDMELDEESLEQLRSLGYLDE